MYLIKQMSEAFQPRDFSSKINWADYSLSIIDQHTYLHIQFQGNHKVDYNFP